MTEDEIRNMEAGRELDALVAEKLMGWTQEYMIDIYGEATPVANAPSYLFPPNSGDLDDVARVPDFSTDIAAAWQVVEKMLASGLDFSMANTENLAEFQWGVDFYIMIDEAAVAKIYSANAPTAPLAICRAALLAVMSESNDR